MAANAQFVLADEALPCDLIRQDLYEQVCETQLGRLARRKGISIERLIEACVLLAVPIPSLGYWGEKVAGVNPAWPILPPYSGPQVYRTTSATPNEIRMIIGSPRCPTLLSDEDVVVLTGRKFARQQIDQLKKMQILFAISLGGIPLVPVAAIEGRNTVALQRIRLIESKNQELTV